MAPNENDPTARLARAMELLLKLKIHEIKGDRNQSQMILLLGKLGASAAEIATLLGASRATIDPLLSRARSAKKAKPARPARRKVR